MTIKDLFERVLMQVEISEQKFCEFFNECVQILITQYGEKFVIGDGGSREGIKSVQDSSDLFEDYFVCVPNYIFYKLGSENDYQLFAFNGKNAYLNVWRNCSKGKSVKARLGGGRYV